MNNSFAEKIKNKDVLILCSGNSVLRYKDKIISYIKNNDLVVIGCNRILDLFVPDYHVFTDFSAFKNLVSFINKKSILVLNSNFKEKDIRELWKGSYERLLIDPEWSPNNSITISEEIKYKPLDYKDGIIYGPFETVGTISIFWAYLNGAKEITVVGMDGYGYYSKEKLDKGEISQYCYGKGHIWGKLLDEVRDQPLEDRIRSYDRIDKVSEIALKSMKEYGVNFKIITPTIFKEHYSSQELECL